MLKKKGFKERFRNRKLYLLNRKLKTEENRELNSKSRKILKSLKP